MTEADFQEKKAELDEILGEAKARKERAGRAKEEDRGRSGGVAVASPVATHADRVTAAASEARFAAMLRSARARRKEVDRFEMPEEQKKELESRLEEIEGLLEDEDVALRGGVSMPPPQPWAGNDEPTHPHLEAMPDVPGFASARTVPGEGPSGDAKSRRDEASAGPAPPHPPSPGPPPPAPPVPVPPTPKGIKQNPHQPDPGAAG